MLGGDGEEERYGGGGGDGGDGEGYLLRGEDAAKFGERRFEDGKGRRWPCLAGWFRFTLFSSSSFRRSFSRDLREEGFKGLCFSLRMYLTLAAAQGVGIHRAASR